jgi:hypothetical protein
MNARFVNGKESGVNGTVLRRGCVIQQGAYYYDAAGIAVGDPLGRAVGDRDTCSVFRWMGGSLQWLN